jgi:poly-gamma-glutamate synthesis protein (capsule biosynthesis protein)
MLFCGDFCSKSSTKPITISEELKDTIATCDLKVCNFEVPLKPDEGYFPPQGRERFYQHDDVPDFLRSLGFNLFSIATNHTFDWGDEGFQKTKAVLDDAAFGAGIYDEAYKPKVVEVNGIKIGLIAVCFAAYKGVFSDVDKHDGLGCAYIHDLKVNHVILDTKKKVDYLIVLPHDGIEYIDVPLPETIARYRDFIDYGADAVIGTHPHCPQGWEEYKGRPIFYSLGNFYFNSKDGYDYRASRPHWYEGLCVVLNIDNGTLSWEAVNTRNVDNLRIEIDYDEARVHHNDQLCRYLSNKLEYNDYINKLCAEKGEKELSIVDYTFHSNSLKGCTKQLLRYWYMELRGRDITNDTALIRLLTHDARRNFLMLILQRRK